MRFKAYSPLLVLTLTAFTSAPCYAGWIPNGNVLCDVAGDQHLPQMAEDGSGGVIVVWYDYRDDDSDIYAQRIDASGSVLWSPGGLAVCTALGDQIVEQVIGDGSGGAIIAWYDGREGDYDIYAQRLDALGNALWTEDGLAVCAADSDQFWIDMTLDGPGGAILAWADTRVGFHSADIYTQKIAAAGYTLWDADGVPLCSNITAQFVPRIVTDGSGGAIVAWSDWRNGPDLATDIYAQRVDASGVTQWTPNGIEVRIAPGDQDPVMISDGAGGAIMAWEDYRPNSYYYHIFAQRLDNNGNLLWAPEGAPVCLAEYAQVEPVITADGAGGAIITWSEIRDVANPHYDISAQRIDQNGTALWPLDGVSVCAEIGNQYTPVITGDELNGAVISWLDVRDDDIDVYAQRLDATGAALWTTDGVRICGASANQIVSDIARDGASGAIVAWHDYRDNNADIYALRVDATGQAGDPTAVASPGRLAFRIVSSHPNPTTFGSALLFQLYDRLPLSASIYDLKGRLVNSLAPQTEYSTGMHSLFWDGCDPRGNPVPSGVYFFRLQSEARFEVKKVVVVR